MTPSMHKVLVAIDALTKDTEVGPSLREIAAASGVGLSKVHEAVEDLHRMGKILRGGTRRYRVVDSAPPRIEIERWSAAERLRVLAILEELILTSKGRAAA